MKLIYIYLEENYKNIDKFASSINNYLDLYMHP